MICFWWWLCCKRFVYKHYNKAKPIAASLDNFWAWRQFRSGSDCRCCIYQSWNGWKNHVQVQSVYCRFTILPLLCSQSKPSHIARWIVSTHCSYYSFWGRLLSTILYVTQNVYWYSYSSICFWTRFDIQCKHCNCLLKRLGLRIRVEEGL